MRLWLWHACEKGLIELAKQNLLNDDEIEKLKFCDDNILDFLSMHILICGVLAGQKLKQIVLIFYLQLMTILRRFGFMRFRIKVMPLWNLKSDILKLELRRIPNWNA